MKLSKVTIVNMHDISFDEYEIGDKLHIHGDNGAGKTTILNAIQLALLGYIPGYPKTNEGIFKHAKGSHMEVGVELIGQYPITIKRSWTKHKSSITSETIITPEDVNIHDILNEIELPIFNFNDFVNLTANKLKDWFVNFMPPSDNTLNWDNILASIIDDGYCVSNERLHEIKYKVSEIAANYETEPVEAIKAVNEYAKSEQKYIKASIDENQKTISTLVFNQDIDMDINIDNIKKSIESDNKLLADIKAAKIGEANRAKILADIEKYDKYIEAWHDMYESEDVVKSKLIQCKESGVIFENDLRNLNDKHNALQFELNTYTELKDSIAESGGICPFIKESCHKLAEYTGNIFEKISDISERLYEVSGKLKEYDEVIRQNNDEQTEYMQILANLETAVNNKYIAENQLKEYPELVAAVTEDEIIERLNKNTDIYAKYKANIEYNNLIESLTSNKYKLEQDMEFIKRLVKITDVNNLQTEVTRKQFDEIADKLTDYISPLLTTENRHATVVFNITNKANGFDIGIKDDTNDFISYNTLSSGEKCLFAIGLMSYIIEESDCPLKLMLIDDILDHLDAENIRQVFNYIDELNVQVISAGVVKPENSNVPVIFI